MSLVVVVNEVSTVGAVPAASPLTVVDTRA